MGIYSYKAYDKHGNIKKGKFKGNNKEEVIMYLRSNNLYPIDIKKLSFLKIDLHDLVIFNKHLGLTKRDLMFFCRQMAFIIGSGIPITLGIDTVEKQCSSKILKEELLIIKDNILKGSSLSKAMEDSNRFPELLCTMVKIGEETGKLHQIMEQMENHYEKEASTLEYIKSSLIYPAFVFMGMLLVIVIAIVYLIPNYTVIFLTQDILLPLPTRILINISNFINNYYILIISFIFVLIILLFNINKNTTVKTCRDKLVYKIPILNKLLKLLPSLRFSQSMGIMLEAGVPILKAVSISKNLIKNYEFKRIMEEIYKDLIKGTSLKVAIERVNFFHPVLISMVNIGEESGNLAEALHKSSAYFTKEITYKIRHMKKFIEPTITIILGIILAVTMLAIMLPTFRLTNII